jgi:hypothetical protein
VIHEVEDVEVEDVAQYVASLVQESVAFVVRG